MQYICMVQEFFGCFTFYDALLILTVLCHTVEITFVIFFFFRGHIYRCCWKSILCCPRSTSEALWSRGGCLECWCNYLYLVNWGPTILGWWEPIICVLLKITKYCNSDAQLDYNLLKSTYFFRLLSLQKQSMGYLNKF